MEYRFTNCQPVHFDLRNGMSGLGFIVGCATNGVVILGKTYMVEVSTFDDGVEHIPSEEYPFRVIPVFERDLIPQDE